MHFNNEYIILLYPKILIHFFFVLFKWPINTNNRIAHGNFLYYLHIYLFSLIFFFCKCNESCNCYFYQYYVIYIFYSTTGKLRIKKAIDVEHRATFIVIVFFHTGLKPYPETRFKSIFSVDAIFVTNRSFILVNICYIQCKPTIPI